MINYTHQHPKLGAFKVVINKKTKRYILKVKHGEVLVTVPPIYSIDLVNELLDTHAEDVIKALNEQGDCRLREGFVFESTLTNIYIKRSTLTKPSLKREGNDITILLSRSQDETTEHSQMILTKIIETHLKDLGYDRIASRLKYWAAKMNLGFERFKLGNAKSSWGKCDSLRNIVISVYAVLLPDHLLDYLLVHELAHISEMNHSDRFWALVDQYTDHKANALCEELKGYNTSIVQFKKP